jgi:2-polyprenyl-3-methyl-5-hydroxy-6-metoxy-1,4-benzoquinol methylase
MSHNASTAYVMGHDEREHRRLALQASILNPFTEQLLRRAGIAPGMGVLDLGCGVGEVSMIAARLVGRHGQVVGIDADESALMTAQEKAQQQGIGNIAYVHSDVHSYRPERLFDAVTGRFILVHTPNPLSVVQASFSMLNPRGVAIFQEYEYSFSHPACPELPLDSQIKSFLRDFFAKVCHVRVGTELFHLFIEAGFSSPDCRVEYPIDGGPDSPFYEWRTESLRTILPRAKALGLAHDFLGDIDTLAQRLREEAVSGRSGVPGPVMVGGFARKP